MPKNTPNILFIISDSTRADKVSCYGYRRKTTPNVDQLAREGTKFTNAVPQGVWTLPSHASFFTGLYPSEHGLLYGKEDLNMKLNQDLPTLAEFLKSKGYTTIGISNNPWVGALSGMDRGFDFFMESDGRIRNDVGMTINLPFQISLIRKFGSLTNKFLFKLLIPYLVKRPVFTKFSIDLTINLMEEVLGRNRKFFVFINFMDTHQPYYPPKKNLTSVNAKRHPLSAYYVNYKIYEYSEGKRVKDIERMLNDYCNGSLNYLDEQLGRLFDAMRRKRIMDDTFIVFTSDHGKNLGERSVKDKMSFMKDNILRVPLVVRCPELVPQGKEIDSEVQLIDIYYTIQELVEGDDFVKKHENDLTLLDALKGRKRGYSYVEAAFPFNILQEKSKKGFSRDYVECIRTREKKLVESRDEGTIAYDLMKDPDEERGVSNLDEFNIDDLKSYLDLHRKMVAKGDRDKLKDTIRRLKSSGKL